MPSIPYFEIHAFADPDRAFSGNPAGVCLLDTFPDEAVMLGIAASNNLSETAFLVPRQTGDWDLRWFTPAMEVDLCGHATLAAGAVVLDQAGAGNRASFHTRSGVLHVERTGARYAMDLPQIGFRPGDESADIRDALGIGAAPASVMAIDRIHGAHYQMWVLASEAAVKTAIPDHGQLRALQTNIILTAPGEAVDFVSRFFAPASGVDEDPVTGSAHCTLAPYWTQTLGKARLSARQIGPRPGALEVECRGDRVTLHGAAPRYLAGQIVV